MAVLKPASTAKNSKGNLKVQPWVTWVWPALVFIIAGSVFVATSAPNLTWRNGGDDGGDLATAAQLLGIPHPTGYPLYLLLAQPLIRLGLTAARALNLMSAWWGAWTCTLLYLSVTKLWRLATPLASPNLSTTGGLAAAGLLAFSPLFWSQAVIAEVYTFGTALLAFTIWQLVGWLEAVQFQATGLSLKERLGLVLLAAGLAAAHHRTGLLTLPGLLVAVIVSLGWQNSLDFAKSLRWRNWLTATTLFLAGFLPYLYVLARGGQTPAANWFDPGWPNVGGFWNEFSATFYHNLLLAAPLSQSVGRVAASIQLLQAQFGSVGLVLGLAGWWACFNLPKLKPVFWFALVSISLHSGFAIIYAADNSQVYLLPTFVIWAGLAGIGWLYLLTQLKISINRSKFTLSGLKIEKWIMGLALAGLTGLTSLELIVNFNTVDVSHDTTAATWAAQTLANAPVHAILLSNEDKYTFGLWYEEYALGYRPDVALVETRLLAFDWYRHNLARLYPNLHFNWQNLNSGSWLTQLLTQNPGLPAYNVTLNGLQATHS